MSFWGDTVRRMSGFMVSIAGSMTLPPPLPPLEVVAILQGAVQKLPGLAASEALVCPHRNVLTGFDLTLQRMFFYLKRKINKQNPKNVHLPSIEM